MRLISYFFFYTYTGLVIAAGLWGAFINPAFDFKLLMNMDIHALPDTQRINMLSQYRFLRALEFGFGLFSVLFTRNVFNENKFNKLFLLIMLSGILARLTSVLVDGKPNMLMYFFMIYEFIGLIFIYLYSSTNIKANAGV